MNNVDKLKKLISTGKIENIEQALELAKALFDKNSKEMRQVERAVGDFLQEKADKFVEQQGRDWNTPFVGADDILPEAWVSFSVEIPYRLELQVDYREGKITLEVIAFGDWNDRYLSLIHI